MDCFNYNIGSEEKKIQTTTSPHGHHGGDGGNGRNCPFELDREPFKESLIKDRAHRYAIFKSMLPKRTRRENSVINQIDTWDSIKCAADLIATIECYEKNIHSSLCRAERGKLDTCLAYKL